MITIPFIILALAILADLGWNQGDGISNIFSSIRSGRVTPEENKYSLIREIMDKIDSLYDDLGYEEVGSSEFTNIQSKIKVKEKILEKIL